MARLPVIGGDEDYWGNVLVEFLEVEHDSDGTHKIRKIRDEDDDTCFETERSADDDIVRAKAGGQDIFEGYSSGIFSLMKQSYVSVSFVGTQTISHATDAKIQIGTVDYDEHGEWNTTDYRFTATKAGIYIVSLRVRWATASLGVLYQKVHKNGSVVNHSETAFSYDAGIRFATATVAIKLDAGDYLEGWVYQESGGDLDLQEAYMTIIKVA